MNKLVACGFALVASSAVASPNVADLTAQARAAKGGTASASSSGAYGAGGAFDGGVSSSSSQVWISGGTGEQWLQYVFKDAFKPGNALRVLSYGIYYYPNYSGKLAAATCQQPKTWKLQGTDDGEIWTTLDERENFTDWGSSGYTRFVCATPGTFRTYRLVITAAVGASATAYQVIELALYGQVLDVASEADGYKTRMASGGNWDDAEGWTPVGVPAAGDTVVVPPGVNVGVTGETARISKLYASGTVTMSGEAACLKVVDAAVELVGVLTCAAATVNDGDYTDQTINRVNVDCATLTVASGCSVTANGKGWLGCPNTTNTRGYGPGTLSSGGENSLSPSHGGHGGNYYSAGSTSKLCTRPYGSAAEPTTPGSSGGSTRWGVGRDGGGIVRIVATGAVTVDGTVSANGVNAGSYNSQPGSGGSVWITCQSLAGKGTVSATGGKGYNLTATGSRRMLPAGGGRIAVDYDPVAQAAADVTGLKVVASSGVFEGACTTHAGIDAYAAYYRAGEGTLHFTDATLVDQLIGKGLSGEIRGVTEYTYDGDLDFTYGYVRFAEDGVKVRVKGDLALSGTDARIDIGGSVLTNVYFGPILYAGTVASSLTVDGDLSLEGVSCLDVRAASLSDDPVGATVTVGGTMSVGSGCFVYTRSDCFLPSSPRFHVGNLTVAEGGTMTAFASGGKGAWQSWTAKYRGHPDIPKGAADYGVSWAGSHGGQGAYGDGTSVNRSAPYDDAVWPVYPGSGGSNGNNTWHTGGMGGGVISVVAPNGTIRIDGTLNADGGGGNLVSNYDGGGGSGGTILLSAARVFSGATGVLTAKGGTSNPDEKGTNVYCGGGGRISILIGEPYYAGIPKGRVKVSETAFAPTDYPDAFEWLGTVSVAGGQPSGARAEELGHAGEDGTIRFCHVNEAPGCLLLVR